MDDMLIFGIMGARLKITNVRFIVRFIVSSRPRICYSKGFLLGEPIDGVVAQLSSKAGLAVADSRPQVYRTQYVQYVHVGTFPHNSPLARLTDFP